MDDRLIWMSDDRSGPTRLNQQIITWLDYLPHQPLLSHSLLNKEIPDLLWVMIQQLEPLLGSIIGGNISPSRNSAFVEMRRSSTVKPSCPAAPAAFSCKLSLERRSNCDRPLDRTFLRALNDQRRDRPADQIAAIENLVLSASETDG